MPAVVGGLSSRSYGSSVHPSEVEGVLLSASQKAPLEVEGVLLRMWSSAVSSSLQMSAPQKALYQPSQAWWKTPPGPHQHSAKYGRSLLTEIIKVEINTGQVIYLLHDYDDNNTE